MRSYTTVRDILRHISGWRQELLENCDNGSRANSEEPFGALIEYLAVHERALKDILDGDHGQEHETTMNTWLQYVPAEDVEEVIQRWRAAKDPSAEDVMQLLVEFNDALVEFYRSLANQSQAPPRVNAVFQNLLDAEEWQQLRTAWAIRDSDSYYTGRG